MNLVHENNWIIMPADCNYQYPMVFGGAFMAQVDLCAAACANRLLHDSECDSAVTYKILEGVFYLPCEAGDLVFMRAEVVELRNTAIVIDVMAEREKRNSPKREKAAFFKFVFVSRKDGKYWPHRLKLPEKG